MSSGLSLSDVALLRAAREDDPELAADLGVVPQEEVASPLPERRSRRRRCCRCCGPQGGMRRCWQNNATTMRNVLALVALGAVWGLGEGGDWASALNGSIVMLALVSSACGYPRWEISDWWTWSPLVTVAGAVAAFSLAGSVGFGLGYATEAPRTGVTDAEAVSSGVSGALELLTLLALNVLSTQCRSRAAENAVADREREAEARRIAREKLPLRELRAEDVGAVHAERQNCPVCLEVFAENDEQCVLPCFHAFHQPCIDEWLQSHSECPICRHSILVNSFPAA